MIERDPTRKATIKGKMPRAKKIKYLNQFELHTLIAHLDVKEEVSWDWFILLFAGVWIASVTCRLGYANFHSDILCKNE